MAISPLLRQAILDQLGHDQTRYPNAGAVGRIIDPRTVQTPALDLIDQALTTLLDTPDGRLIITMPPQEGNSTRGSRDLPIWALLRNPDLRIVSASYAQGLANRNGRAVRNAILAHPELGLRIAADNGAASEWTIAGHQGGVLSVGRGAGVTGRPSDLLIVDDPLKDRAEADSEVIRDTCWDWWTDALSARLAPGAPVLVILTRWHEDDLAGRLLTQDRGYPWKVLNIPAQCEDEATDPLGRQVGEFMQSARGRTLEQWENRKATAGARTWAALYQGRPTAAEGGLIKRDWLARRYSYPLWEDRDGHNWLIGFDDVLISADLTFKGTEHSDYVAIGVWARRGADVYLLDQVRARLDFMSALRAFEQLVRLWPQATLKLVEDKANGPALMSMLGRRIPGIVPYEPRGSKQARANAWAPFAEAGNVWLPSLELAPWVDEYVEELAAFPNGAHDDQVDQTSMALDRLLVRPLADSTVYDEDDYDDYRIGY